MKYKSRVALTFEKHKEFGNWCLSQVEELIGTDLEHSDVEKIVALQQNSATLKTEVIHLMDSLGYKHENKTKHDVKLNQFFEYFNKKD